MAVDTTPLTFKFSLELKVPHLTFPLAAGTFPLLNKSFLVSDDDLGYEELLVGQPVLHHH